jgi:hypothetical protein
VNTNSADPTVILGSSTDHSQNSAGVVGAKVRPAIDHFADAPSLDRVAANWPVFHESAAPKKRISIVKDRVSVVKTLQDLRKIGELRYSMYIEKDKKAYVSDASNRCFLELVDLDSLNLLASSGAVCLGGVRLTKATNALKDEFLERLLSRTPFDRSDYEKVVVCSRLVLAHTVRARFQMLALLKKTMQVSLTSGAEYAVMCTRQALVPLFTKMGWVQYGSSYHEAIAGELFVLIFDLQNSTTRSIFLKIYDAFKHRKKPQVGI